MNRDQQSIIPLTIKQVKQSIKNQLEDAYTVDGVTLHLIKLVATIETKEEHSTNFTYEISDGTGKIECKKWVDSNSQASQEDRNISYNFIHLIN